MRPGQVSDEAGMCNQTRPRAAGGQDDLTHPRQIGRKRNRGQRGTVRSKEGEVGCGVAANDARDDLPVRRSRTDLLVGVEEMVGDDKGLGIDDRAGGRAPAPSAKKREARGGPGGRAHEIIRKLLCN